MSQTDMAAPVSAKVTHPPVALMINCPDAQRYLHENEVLAALYGCSPVRLEVKGNNVAWCLFDPTDENGIPRLELLVELPYVTLNGLPAFIKSEQFQAALYTEILSQVGMIDDYAVHVQAIIADE